MFCVTFYSFKGGVGRTMALINTAILLSQKRKKVLIVDFDLEAPGISSYNSFREINCVVGLVDVVERYAETGRAENINEYIQKARIGNDEVWVLPAGNHNSPQYGPRFSGIDWNRLYEEKHGFLFFEDMRQQWENAGFDYVLIDSRTGHTDTAGICTRQLPDLVVSLFVPTDQNIRGLAPILSEMIEGTSPRVRHVEHMVCASNVPDVDDEDDVIGQQLKLARDLFPSSVTSRQDQIPILNHYISIDMLAQREFVVGRPKSRLAKQYKQLYEEIIRHNLGDREGALTRLNHVIARLDHSQSDRQRVTNNHDEDKHFELVSEIRSIHAGDGEIEFLCARIARHIGDLDTEISSLSASIDKGYRATVARLNRSSAYVLSDARDDAANDLIDVAHGAQSSQLEIRAAISRLRTLLNDSWLDRLTDGVFSLDGKQSLIDVLAYEVTRDRKLAIRFNDFLKRLCASSDETHFGGYSSLDNIALLKISALRPEEALQFIDLQGDDLRIQDHFNAGIARWMISGVPNREDFTAVLEMSGELKDRNANVVQCLMLASSVAEESERKRFDMANFLWRFPVSGFHFNCDSFILSPASAMAQALSKYKKCLLEGQEIIPSIVAEYKSCS